MNDSSIRLTPNKPLNALAPLACPRCGTVDTPTIGPGAGPHHDDTTLAEACPFCGTPYALPAQLAWSAQASTVLDWLAVLHADLHNLTRALEEGQP